MAATTSAGYVCTAANPSLLKGDVVFVEKELMLVAINSTAAGDGETCDLDPTGGSSGYSTLVSRALAGTTGAAHAVGTEVRLSNFARRFVTTMNEVKKDDVLVGGLNRMYIALADRVDCSLAAECSSINGALIDVDVNGVDGTANEAADTSAFARFSLHGNTSVLRRAVPTVTVAATPAAGNTLGTQAQFTTMGVNITASGEGQVELTPGNGNTMTFAIIGSGLDVTTNTAYCGLYNAANSKLLAAEDTTGYTPGAALTFTMGVDNSSQGGLNPSATGLTVPVGTTGKVELKCTTDSTSGSGLSATMTGMTLSLIHI